MAKFSNSFKTYRLAFSRVEKEIPGAGAGPLPNPELADLELNHLERRDCNLG